MLNENNSYYQTNNIKYLNYFYYKKLVKKERERKNG